jgi:hypothetical protein
MAARHIKQIILVLAVGVCLVCVVSALWPARTAHSQTPPNGAPAWIQWKSSVGGNNHYYALTPSAMNWIAAQNLAESWGGALATITSSEEQEFVNTAFLTGPFEHLPVWIGLKRTSSSGATKLAGRLRRAMEDLGIIASTPPKGAFEWVTGEAFACSNWKPGEPSNNPPGEEYVAINWEYSDNPPRGIKGD